MHIFGFALLVLLYRGFGQWAENEESPDNVEHRAI
jgi:hypothetical protein